MSNAQRLLEMEQFIRQMAEARKYGAEFEPSDPNDAEQFCNVMIDKARDILFMDASESEKVNGWANRETWSFNMHLNGDTVAEELETIIETLIGDNDWNSRQDLDKLVSNARYMLVSYLREAAEGGGYFVEEIDLTQVADGFMDGVSFYEAGYQYDGCIAVWETRVFVDFYTASRWVAAQCVNFEIDTDFVLRQQHPFRYMDGSPKHMFWVDAISVDSAKSNEKDARDMQEAIFGTRGKQ